MSELLMTAKKDCAICLTVFESNTNMGKLKYNLYQITMLIMGMHIHRVFYYMHFVDEVI